jgi:hypothetical protein
LQFQVPRIIAMLDRRSLIFEGGNEQEITCLDIRTTV